MSKPDVNLCKQMREEGKTYEEIADHFNTSKQMIYYILDKAGTPRKTKYSPYYLEWEKLYKEGIAIHKIAEKYNCSYRTVYDYLSKKLIIERGKLMRERGKQKPASELISTETAKGKK